MIPGRCLQMDQNFLDKDQFSVKTKWDSSNPWHGWQHNYSNYHKAWEVLQASYWEKTNSRTYHCYDNNKCLSNLEEGGYKDWRASWILVALENIYTENKKLEFVTVQLKTPVENWEDSTAEFEESFILQSYRRCGWGPRAGLILGGVSYKTY